MLKYLSIYLSPATEVVAAENWLPPELEKLASQTFTQCAHSTHTYTLLNITLLKYRVIFLIGPPELAKYRPVSN